MEPHDEFLELCALSTSGELSDQEQAKLRAHLAGCAGCREALQEFEAAVDVGVPLLGPKLSAEPDHVLASRIKSAKSDQTAPSRVITPSQPLMNDADSAPDLPRTGFAFDQRDGHERTHMSWNYVWISFAACVLLTIALGIYAYRSGKGSSVAVAQKYSSASDVQIVALEQEMSDVGRDREELRAELTQRDTLISELKHQIQQQSASLNEIRSVQSDLEKTVQSDEGEKQRIAQEQSELAQKLDSAQVLLQRSQSQLGVLTQQRSDDEVRAAVMESHVHDLNEKLRDRELTIDKQEELLSHDRDVRELMGARDLYIAEIYDVARDGVQKPYGRVFYTKGKSLIFYAYDLDQQPGVKNARTFQAWGQRGPDRRQALNLGIFFEDNAAKKRWVLKFDDPKTLAQIDAVFVTVEPNGGSHEPSGNPLLFTYLKIESNHP